MEQKETNSAAAGCEIGTRELGMRFEARLSCVPAAMEYLAAEMRRAGATPEALLRAELILEELLRNSVLHGYLGDSASPVWLAPAADGFRYQDEAPPFNPLADGPEGVAPDPGRSIEEQPVGGAGLLLIRQLARSLRYARQDGRNRLDVTVSPERESG
ncbi:ATP-binding protein [Pseudoduganella sp. LjRoot289]|uniref:ATP-binding protein n=1 Tax=Pseudoduganella sp. LjRoot289 TaxID=3342314 RepID=UPI003ED08908